MELEELIKVLEISVQRNGEKPLTNKWLLNILKLTQKRLEQEEIAAENYAIKTEHFWK
jgi:hypothetical protein